MCLAFSFKKNFCIKHYKFCVTKITIRGCYSHQGQLLHTNKRQQCGFLQMNAYINVLYDHTYIHTTLTKRQECLKTGSTRRRQAISIKRKQSQHLAYAPADIFILFLTLILIYANQIAADQLFINTKLNDGVYGIFVFTYINIYDL